MTEGVKGRRAAKQACGFHFSLSPQQQSDESLQRHSKSLLFTLCTSVTFVPVQTQD